MTKASIGDIDAAAVFSELLDHFFERAFPGRATAKHWLLSNLTHDAEGVRVEALKEAASVAEKEAERYAAMRHPAIYVEARDEAQAAAERIESGKRGAVVRRGFREARC